MIDDGGWKMGDGGRRTEDERNVDLSALGPSIARERFATLVAAAARAGEDELRRRRGAIGVVRVVIAWRRPVLAFSGLAAAAAIVLLTRATSGSASGSASVTASSAPGTVAEALGIPAGYAQSVEGRSIGAPNSGTERP